MTPDRYKTDEISSPRPDELGPRLDSQSHVQVTEPVLASFVVLAYNQQNYIREAVAGAFSQTYSPLDIILSDDCSTDATYAIMEEMAREYRGPHRVRLRRNEHNLGIAGHVNRTFDISKGDIWVGAAGDDVSLAERTAKSVDVFRKYPDTTSVVTYAELFGGLSGLYQPYFIDRKLGIIEACWTFDGALGCSSAYSRQLYTHFGPLAAEGNNEDVPMLFRSLSFGRHRVIREALVKYRIHEASVSRAVAEGQCLRGYRNELAGLRQIKRDLPILTKQTIFTRWLCHALIDLRIARLTEAEHLAKLGRASSWRFTTTDFLLHLGKVCRLFHPIDWAKRRVQLMRGEAL